MADGEVVVGVKADTASFEKNLNAAKAQAEKFDKEATGAAAAASKLAKTAAEAAKGAAKLKSEVAASAKGTSALRKTATEASKGVSDLKKQTSEAAKAAKALEKDAKSSAKGTAAVKLEAAAAAKRVDALRAAAQEAAREIKVLRKAAEESAKRVAALKRESGEAAKKARALKAEASNASKSAKRLAKESATAARSVRKLQKEAAKKGVSKYQKAIKSAAESSALLTGPLGGIASRLSILGRVSSIAGAAVLALSVSVGALTLGLGAAISEAEKFQTSSLRVQAVLKATGNSAGITATEIRELSREIARSTLAGTAGVEAAAAKLLTFKSVQGDVFRDALKLSQDLADLGFGSVSSGAVQLGKALQDPVAGLSALKRIGVDFSATQKEQIRQFVETNQLVKAQALIIKALNDQVGGTGVKAAEGLAGSYDGLGQSISELFQNIGNAGPLQAMTEFTTRLGRSVEGINALLFDLPENRISKLQELLADLRVPQQVAQGSDTILAALAKQRVADIKGEIAAIRNKILAEVKASAAAKESAKVSAAAAKEDARLGKILEARAKEQERLAKLRESTKRGITEEVAALQQLSAVFVGSTLSAREFALAEQQITTLSKLNLDATSKEGQEISALIQKRMELAGAIAQERREREQGEATATRLQALEAEITATEMLTASIGKSASEVRAARVEVQAYRIEQELTAAALKSQESLTTGQTQAIRDQAQALAETTVRLEDLQTAQSGAFAAEEAANDRRLEFQETLASGLTSLVFETDNLGDALKRMVLQMSQAIVQAQILQAIQLAAGTSSTGAGGGSIFNAVVGAFAGATSPGTDTTTATRMHRGGRVGSAGQSISVPSSNFISAPRFHDGLKPDEFPAILQRGEEVVPKDQVGAQRTGGRDIVFNVTTPDADSFRKSQRQLSRSLKQTTAAT